VTAGDGDDTVYVNTGNAVHAVDCGPGADTIVINPRSVRGGVTNLHQIADGRISSCETVVAQMPPVDPLKGIWQKVGSPDGGRIVGTDLNDRLFGEAGPDTLIGGPGDDELWGNHLPTGTGFGTDHLDGGPGDDTIFGGRVRNIILGGPGDDTLQNGIRWNKVYGGPGNDEITGRGDGRGPNWYYGGAGDDRIAPRSKGPALVDCGPGYDVVTIGFNREVRWRRDCEKVTTRYRRR
jgi:Ca2+-binding RTX toxin-like protein